MTSVLSDGELLAHQLEHALTPAGRVRNCYGVTVAVPASGGDASMWIGDQVQPWLIEPILSLGPTILDGIIAVLAEADIVIDAGPSYVVPDTLDATCDFPIVCSGSPAAVQLLDANPGNWEPLEWSELLAGDLGPYALAVDAGRVVSICHTPHAMTARSAECGVWTDPAYRGRGLATATVAAWLPLVRSPDRRIFYSTNDDNVSSQRVAARLSARKIGWIWRSHRPRAGLHVHPLSTLAH